MTLNNLHDRVLGPAMGFTRHYHSYQFIASQNGACFGPHQMLYGRYGNPPMDYPEIQLQRMFAGPVVRELKARAQTQAHKDLCTKIFVFKFELVPRHTTEQWDSGTQTLDDNSAPVFRIVSCFGGMTLNNLHDRVLGPAMGFTRHYHSYQFIASQNGACFGKENKLNVLHCFDIYLEHNYHIHLLVLLHLEL